MPPVLPDVDRDLLDRLLLRVEADAHRKGWDGPSDLLALYDARDHQTDQAYRQVIAGIRGPATRCGPYAAQPFAPLAALDGYASHAVFRMALNFKGAADDPRVAPIIGVMRQPGFLGVALVCETWSRSYRDPAERDADGNARFADIPGSVEARMVSAADVAGADHVVKRDRGQKPTVLPMDDIRGIDGAVFESLRVITAIIAGLPAPELTNAPSMWSWGDQEREDAS